MTEAEEVHELLSDQLWRLNNLYWCIDPEGKPYKFTMNWAQKLLFYGLHYLNLILKARQVGITTFFCIYALDLCLFNPNKRAGIIAHNLDDAMAFFRDKVKYPYEHLGCDLDEYGNLGEQPEWARALFPGADQDRTNQLSFDNNSSIRVGTSMRSGTLNFLHVSEFGKICAKYPERAREIVTGAFNTVHVGQIISVESTAEGSEGYFFRYCETAFNRELQGAGLSELDFKPFFFAWWQHPSYKLRPTGVVITKELAEYFAGAEKELGITLSAEQRAWYAKKYELMEREGSGGDMRREYPATWKEAFESAVVGAYLATQMAWLRKNGRVGRVPWVPNVPVDTFWDLGMDDAMTIVFHQWTGFEHRLIDYEEDSGYGFEHYAELLRRKPYHYGRHFLPHDVEQRLLNKKGTKRKQELLELGIRPVITVPRPQDKVRIGVAAVRKFLYECAFDQENCAPLIKSLDNFRREWDDKTGRYKDRPLHDWAIHGFDAMQTGALGWTPPANAQSAQGWGQQGGWVANSEWSP